jgi:hypothetical protein
VANDTTALVEAIRRAARVSNGSDYYETSTILTLASDEQKTRVVPALLEARGGYLLYNANVPLVNGRASYRLPVRAIREGKVRLVDAAGKTVVPFERIAAQLADDVQPAQGRPRYWLPENNAIRLLPTPTNTSDVLRLGYYRWPNALVLRADCAWVLSVDVSTGTFLVEWSGDMPVWLVTGEVADIIRGTPGFESIADDVAITSVAVSGSTATVEVDNLPADLQFGDWLCFAGTTPFPQLPLAYHDVLVEATAARIHFEQGDAQAEASALARYERKLQAVASTLSPRTEEPEVVVPGQDWF